MNRETEQEKFWSGDFGDDYIDRNRSDALLASNLNYFTKAPNCAGQVSSVVELGANIGMNLRALKLLYPSVELHGIEINAKASDELGAHIGKENVFSGSIFDYSVERTFDLSLTKGVLIHIKPEKLIDAYNVLYASSSRYILIGEYYNPVPVSINYRGHAEKLYKRDFCGEMLDLFPDLRLVDYGYIYKRDPAFSQDDITWFLMEK